MKPLSKQVNNLEDVEKFQSLKESDKVDINVLFDSEKLKSESLTEQKSLNERTVEQYVVQNEANIEQRHVILKQTRLTRGLSLVLGLLVAFCFLGIGISGAVYLQNRHHSKQIHNFQPSSLEIVSDKLFVNSTKNNTANKEIIDSLIEIDDKNNEALNNELSNDDLESTLTDTSDVPHDSNFLEELVPDSQTNRVIEGLINRMTTAQNEYRVEDLPLTLSNIMRFLRGVFNIPRVRLDYD
jgi:hypothetical protein